MLSLSKTYQGRKFHRAHASDKSVDFYAECRPARVFKMVTTTHLEPVANTFLILTNILNTVKIDKLVVPGVVASDCAEAVLACQYSGVEDDLTVQWLHDGAPVYEWSRGAVPAVSGLLDGRLDLTYRITSPDSTAEGRALRIVQLSPELSGDYTCVVRSRGREARATSTMTVFSPEQDFELTFTSLDSDVVDIKCSAKHLHPQPDLTIEYNKAPVAQQQRTWRVGAYFEARAAASLPRAALRPRAHLACRLRLPQVDYTAITNKYLYSDNLFNGGSILSSPSSFTIGLVIIVLHLHTANK